MSNLFGSSIFNRSHKYLSTYNKRYLLAIGRNNRFRSSTSETIRNRQFLIITNQRNSYLFRFSIHRLCIDFPIVCITKRSVISHREESHRISLKRGDRLYFFRIIQRETIDIKRSAITFTQEINLFAVRTQYRITVLTSYFSQVSMLAGLCIVHPYIASNGRCMMLTPFTFYSFLILIQEEIARRSIANHFSRCTKHLLRTSARYRYFIKLSHSRFREKRTRSRVLNRSREHNVFSVRSKSRRYFRS